MITVTYVTNKKELKSFIDFPASLYTRDEPYVMDLYIAQRDLLTPGKHPFHEHSIVQPMLAWKNGVIKGRIAAILNKRHNEFNNTEDGFFGFFECVEDESVAIALLDAASSWLKQQNVKTIIGPVNPSTNEPCGLLIDGFEYPAVTMTVYNKPYYHNLLKAYGLEKKVDLLAHQLITDSVNMRSVKLEKALLERLKRNGITIRHVNPKKLKEEAARVMEVYNAAWDKNMGFVPVTDNEFQYLAKDLSLILDKQLCLIAEKEGKFIGFALAIPDINQPIKKLNKGRLLPFGWLKLLLGIKKIDGVRILALGVKEEYRKLGIEACFYAGLIRRATERGIKTAEASWILEHNDLMNKGIEDIGGKVYRRFRIYEKQI